MSYADNVRVVGAYAGILSPTIALLGIILAIYQNPGFSLSTSALSDLGSSGTFATFNMSIMLSGILLAIFFISLTYFMKKPRAYCAIGIIGAVALEMLGIFNETYSAHVIFSFIYFVLVPISVVGISASEPKIPSGLRSYGIFAGVASILAILAGFLAIGIGFAVNELIEALLLSIWAIAISALMLKKKV